MDFLNKAKESITGAGKNISQKANDVSGFAKVTTKLHELDKNYEAYLKELAEAMLGQHYEEVKAMCPDVIARIEENRAEYESSKKEQILLKGNKICPNCGAEQEKNAIHCSICGTNMAEAEVIMVNRETTDAVCPKCGQKLTPGAKFCAGCGTQV